MNRRFRIFVTLFFSWIVLATNSVAFAAKAPEAEKPPEWILSYALAGMLIGLALLAIVRSSKRKESIISEYDRKRMQEEELKQLHDKH